MQKPLVFMMGKSPVFLPVDRAYVATHMWVRDVDRGVLRFGFTAYAVKLLGDIRSLRWSVEAPAQVAAGRTLGHIEASKAVSDLYSPVDGQLVATNAAVLDDPTLINSNLYDDAWLFELRCTAQRPLLSPQEYVAHLEKAWPLAERLLKGQLARRDNVGSDT